MPSSLNSVGNMKKKIALYGAYDRYNYGDNLMPILLEMYIKKYHPKKLNEYEFIHTSISNSDLSNYSCFATKSINRVKEVLRKGDVIIVVGGEVLCASNAVLFLHMPKPKLLNDFYRKLNNLPIIRKFFKKWADLQYKAPWDYPYLPDYKMLADGIDIKYNTVGGSLDRLSPDAKKDLSGRLENAQFISVRDQRTFNQVSHIEGVKLYPDSAFIMSDLCSEAFLISNVRDDILEYTKAKYVIFQAAPSKLGDSFNNLVSKLTELHIKNNQRILLLPIGYASGHDDFFILNKVHKKIPQITDIKIDLNIWEIMYLIKHAEFYMGTSLHGVITAMSFGKPHFGINKNIQKLDAFLSDWSIAPFDRCYSVIDIARLPQLIGNEAQPSLSLNADRIISLVKENNNLLFSLNATVSSE
jgi:exopolysaccharide biosynthesis predicted pyruvyltransferase EpsI